MTELLILGAINKQTKQYTHPSRANRSDKFICIDCGNDVMLRKGKIRAHHFAHRKEDPKCDFYNRLTETQIHKSAKILLKHILDNKMPLIIRSKCAKCNEQYEEWDVSYFSENSLTVVEYRFDYDGVKIADVACVRNNEITCIFEICNTHKTQPENRPEPWFELDAKSLIDVFNDSKSQEIKLQCIREKLCDDCSGYWNV